MRKNEPFRARALLPLCLLLFLGGAELRAGSALFSPAPRAPQGLKGAWTFAEGSGTVLGDSSGNGVTGTLTNGPTWTMGRVGTGLNFDGVDDWGKLPDNSPIVQSASAVTVSLWVKPASVIPSGSFRELVSLSVGAANPTNSSRIAFSLQGDGTTGGDLFAGGRSTDAEAQKTVTANANTPVGSWSHLVFVADFAGNTLKIYKGGALLATNGAAGFASPSTPSTASRNSAIGAQDTGDSNRFAGAMDQLQIWNRALSAAEIATLATGEELAARWSLDEGTGGTAGDSSGNAYDGALKNGPFWTTAGQLGNAVTFDGADDWVDLGTGLNVLRNVNSATVTAWIKPSDVIPSGAFREIVSISVNAGSATNVSRVALALKGDGTTGGDLYAGGRSTDSEPQKFLSADTNLGVGAFVHVGAVISFSEKSITLYVNGQPVGSAVADFSQSHTPNTSTTSAALAAQDAGGSNFFKGTLDEVRVYARALPRCDIETLALHDGLHAHWRFDEGAGTVASDASGEGHTGTLTGGATWGTGQFGSAVSLNGTNGYVNLGANQNFVSNARAATVATWVKITTLPANGAFAELASLSVFDAAGPTNVSRLALSLKGDGTGADVFAGGRSTDTEAQQSHTADANLAVGVFYHLAAVVDFSANQIRVYKNGLLVSSQAVAFSQPQTPSTNSTSSALGAQDRGDSNFLAGLLDETRIYCRALTDSEILALATVAVPPAPTNFVANPGNTTAILSWTAAPGATSYNIYQRLDTDPSFPTTPIANTSGTGFTVPGLQNGTMYWFRVRGVNAAGEGAPSNEDDATPVAPGQVPAKPIILTPSKKTNDATPVLVGTAEASVTIKIFFGGVQEAATTQSDFQGNWTFEASSKADAVYTVTAKAQNTFGDSVASDPVQITVDTQVLPPTNVVVTALNLRIHINWSAPANSPDVIGYEVWRSENGAPFAKLHTGLVVGTFYCDATVTNDVPYCYQVRAVDNTLQEAP